eukprot:CAMPEP_0195289384 /NCGR_PEP_ID=MMETSP0707-20130614/5683_1 /TAXON_ID=33640 /ORGANISM="Asterionellopsis glacialis, Strain CCMP134" /LENGTH=649 /DNA_ID=CAMNT_0040349377 /DNA_START=109 /DNA_END=2058 /DNA_ORIENTATION=-
MGDQQQRGKESGINQGGDKTISLGPSDPYATLNVDRNASDESIQRSYKILSRAFHPDKQPPGEARESAQEVFISFKNAYDILTDSVQRQAYDEHGFYGVNVVKKSINMQEKDPTSLYAILVKLHQSNKKEDARLLLKEALQQLDFELQSRQVQFSSALEFPCSTVSTTFLGEGSETLTVPELQGARMSFFVTSAPPTAAATTSSPENNNISNGSSNTKWSVSIGGNTNVKNGKGEGSGQLSIDYQPVQSTNVTCDLDLSNPLKVSLGTTRKFQSRTVVTTKVSTIPKTNTLSLSLISQRALFENNLLGTCALGMGTDLAIHYYLVSCTTLWQNYPQITAKVNLGVDSHPVKLSVKHQFGGNNDDDDSDQERDGVVSYAWGPTGIEMKAVLNRVLSSYASFSIGLQHTTKKGLTWLLSLKRGDITFRVPIHVSTIASSAYSSKVLMLAFLSGLIDNAIAEVVHDATNSAIAKTVDLKSKEQVKRESSLMSLDKSKQDAELQTQLMTNTAKACRELEQSKNGLVILQATYWMNGIEESMDATTQLQFWVKDSCLKLPPTPKSHLLGFYSLVPTRAISSTSESLWKIWNRRWSSRAFRTSQQLQQRPEEDVPQLTVRYESKGGVYEVTIPDDQELILPQMGDMLLGRRGEVL